MALDIESEDVTRVQAHLVGVGGEFDAAGLSSSADLYLRFDDDGVAHTLGNGERLLDGVGDVTGRHRDAEASEVLLALVLKEIHSLPLSLIRCRMTTMTTTELRENRAPIRATCQFRRATHRA